MIFRFVDVLFSFFFLSFSFISKRDFCIVVLFLSLFSFSFFFFLLFVFDQLDNRTYKKVFDKNQGVTFNAPDHFLLEINKKRNSKNISWKMEEEWGGESKKVEEENRNKQNKLTNKKIRNVNDRWERKRENKRAILVERSNYLKLEKHEITETQSYHRSCLYYLLVVPRRQYCWLTGKNRLYNLVNYEIIINMLLSLKIMIQQIIQYDSRRTTQFL